MSLVLLIGSVALRKESVDRNGHGVFVLILCLGSLSARRAWIEITSQVPTWFRMPRSLSARRAWIEIKVRYPWTPLTSVALRKESVDRNGKFVLQSPAKDGRSPQGERG